MRHAILLVVLAFVGCGCKPDDPTTASNVEETHEDYSPTVLSETDGRRRLIEATTIILPETLDDFSAWMDPFANDGDWYVCVAARISEGDRTGFAENLRQTLIRAKGKKYYICRMNPEFGTHARHTGADDGRFPGLGEPMTFRMNYEPRGHDYWGDGVYYPESGSFHFTLEHD